MPHACLVTALAAVLALPLAGLAHAGVAFELPNPSFEEDSELDGVPDGWTVPASTVIERSAHASHGSRSAKFTDGYVLLTLDQQLTGLAGQSVSLSLDVAGEEGAKLGVQLAYQHRQPDGSAKLAYHRLTWDRALTPDFKPLALPLRFADDAVDGRVWLAVYRSNKTGVVYLDNFAVTSRGTVSEEQAAALTRVHREWSYLASAAGEAASRLPGNAEVRDVLQAADDTLRRAARQDAALLAEPDALQRRWREAYARLHWAQSNGKPFVVSWSEGVTRLAPAAPIPANLQADQTHASLAGVYQALGVTVWNAQPEAVTLAVAIEGLDAAAEEVAVRRQVFLENWYDKEKARTADALPQLAQEDGVWQLPLEAGEAVKLYIGYRSRLDAPGEHPVAVTVSSSDGASMQRLSATLEVLPAPLPTTPRLEHWQCIYMNLPPAGQYPELAAKDMARHYVTSAQLPWAPEAEFDSAGHLLSHNFSSTQQAAWMRAYAPHIDKLWLFWEGSLLNSGLKDQHGRKIEPIGDDGQWTPALRTAFTELLRAWLDFADDEGFGIEHWAIAPDDEPHSGDEWEQNPSPPIRRAIELYDLVRQVEPELQIQVTLGIYALAQDAQAVLPHVDVALPIYPYPEKLTRWTPPKYNPREAYQQTTHPLLTQAQQAGELQVWSYRVSRGIKDDLLGEVLSYPVQAVAHDYTGIGYWGYNVTRAKSWDDRDGGLLDYSFIYNGLEDHPLNQQYNVTREIIVPSIRWEALRIGHQHGQVLLYLKDLHGRGRCPAEYQGEVEALLERAAGFTPEPGANDPAEYDAFAGRLLRVYAQVHQAVAAR